MLATESFFKRAIARQRSFYHKEHKEHKETIGTNTFFPHPGSPTLAAEASRNLFRRTTTPTRWIAAVSAAEETSRKVRKVREVLKTDAKRSARTA
ncbi:MAG: hypothetical protein IJF84_06685 [Thermoguttaceae bacterium]|nr:hypothetical protein [Thermoguttaceae bacterium]